MRVFTSPPSNEQHRYARQLDTGSMTRAVSASSPPFYHGSTDEVTYSGYPLRITDDKVEAAIHTDNLNRFKREGFQPGRGIVVALTAGEEGRKKRFLNIRVSRRTR